MFPKIRKKSEVLEALKDPNSPESCAMTRHIERKKKRKTRPWWKRIVLGDDRDEQHKKDDILLGELTNGIQSIINTIKVFAIAMTTVFVMIYTAKQVIDGKSPYVNSDQILPFGLMSEPADGSDVSGYTTPDYNITEDTTGIDTTEITEEP